MKNIPSLNIPIISNGKCENKNLFDLFKNQKIIIFGVPGAFTPTCSESHLPGFIEFHDRIKLKGVKDIYCLSVNDKFVLSAWLNSYEYGYKIKGIADGNAELTQMLNLLNDKRSSFMGFRCTRFAMIINNNFITNFFVEESGGFDQTSAENILLNL